MEIGYAGGKITVRQQQKKKKNPKVITYSFAFSGM